MVTPTKNVLKLDISKPGAANRFILQWHTGAGFITNNYVDFLSSAYKG